MLINLQNPNMMDSLWLLKESLMCVFNKESMRIKIAFY